MRYEVFARINPGDETTHVGSVDAPNDRLATAYARSTYDEEDWDYMAVVRSEDVIPVRGEPPEPAPGGERA